MFKTGDHVKCVCGSVLLGLIEGQEYVVLHGNNNEDTVAIDGIHGIMSSSRFELIPYIVEVVASEFDITADISRQYTRGGDKIDLIFDTNEGDLLPLLVFNRTRNTSVRMNRNGIIYRAGIVDQLDIITRPILLPLEITYQETFLSKKDNLIMSLSCKTIKEIINIQNDIFITSILIEKVTYDPNTKSLSREEVIL
jgi:hypothetical protein